MSEWKVGDEVVLREQRSPDRTVPIVRIGRKYVYTEQYGRERAFDKETGYQAGRVYGYAARIVTPEILAEEQRRTDVVAALKNHKITYDGYGGFMQSTDVLEKLLKVLEGED
ncbi:beta barrel domain-containing protein [Mycolicibacterium llatzerense]|uniref:beta barrel domain-containing protein n=1 Tax=Mycolicibacterium llatzerense TaxID=280871 RepID=UPI0021B55453|nr:hypothetical protein [Mycolicibacterium llatzerense]